LSKLKLKSDTCSQAHRQIEHTKITHALLREVKHVYLLSGSSGKSKLKPLFAATGVDARTAPSRLHLAPLSAGTDTDARTVSSSTSPSATPATLFAATDIDATINSTRTAPSILSLSLHPLAFG
jgi:hypothetical protein